MSVMPSCAHELEAAARLFLSAAENEAASICRPESGDLLVTEVEVVAPGVAVRYPFLLVSRLWPMVGGRGQPPSLSSSPPGTECATSCRQN